MRVTGLDIHRVFAEAVMLENGGVRRLGATRWWRGSGPRRAGHSASARAAVPTRQSHCAPLARLCL